MRPWIIIYQDASLRKKKEGKINRDEEAKREGGGEEEGGGGCGVGWGGCWMQKRARNGRCGGWFGCQMPSCQHSKQPP